MDINEEIILGSLHTMGGGQEGKQMNIPCYFCDASGFVIPYKSGHWRYRAILRIASRILNPIIPEEWEKKGKDEIAALLLAENLEFALYKVVCS